MTQSLPKLRGNRPGVVAALFVLLLFIAGCGGGSNAATPTPTFTPGAGPYSATQNVTVADTNQNAVLYCTNDGSVPTASSPQCANPIKISQSQTLSAIAIAPGMAPSAVATAAYTIAGSASAPTVTGIGPSAGPAAGGTPVTIIGTNFTGATSVNFGTIAATGFTVNSATNITAFSPAGSGTVHVTVVSPAGTSTTGTADLFTYGAAVSGPAVTAISPATGPVAGGVSVTITGTNFIGATSVSFGTVAATSFTVNSATSITAVAPAGSGTVHVTVATPSGTSATSTADQFIYNAVIPVPVVTGISPASGSGAGGTAVTIIGTNFTSPAVVNFGAVAATAVTIVSSNQITAVSPAGGGTVDVKVVTPGGTSATSAVDQFTYNAAPSVPAVTGISPSTGPLAGGTTVTVSGSGFTGVTAVNFGTVAGTGVTVGSANRLTVVSPAGSGMVDITVVNSVGTSTTSAADQFTYTSVLPMINGNVLSGPAGGGVPISASVQLYAAGTANYGAGAQQIGSAVQSDSTTGAFSVPYDCSTVPAPGDQLYLKASGNDRQVVLMAALGSCASFNASATTVIVNEATTIASAYALSAFASLDPSNGGIDIGAPGTGPSCNADAGWKSTGPATCNYIGLQNAFATVNNLVDITNGTALAVTPAYKSNNVLGYNSSIVPQTRIHALANALAACANPATGTGTNCSNLFNSVTGAPADTLQAAWGIALHPGNNASAIAGLAAASVVFPQSLSAGDLSVIGDWVLPIIYQGGGLGGGTTASYPRASGIAIDASGNVWTTLVSSATITNPGGSVAVLSNLGVPLSPSGTSSSSLGGFTAGSIHNPQSIAIDQNGFAWIGNAPTASLPTQGSITVLDVTGTSQYGTGTTPFSNLELFTPAPYGAAVDANNTVWVSSNPGGSNDNACGGGDDTGPFGGSILGLSVSSSTVNLRTVTDTYSGDSCPTFLAVDGSGNLWTYDNGNIGGLDPYGISLTLFSTSGGTVAGGPYYNYFPMSSFSNMAIDGSGNGWFTANIAAGPGGASLVPGIGNMPPIDGITDPLVLNPGGPGGGVPPSPSYSYNPTVFNASSRFTFNSSLALDGAGQAWFVGSVSSHNDGLFGVNNSDNGLISTASGYAGYSQPLDTDTVEPLSTVTYQPSTAVDSSGNVWIVNASSENIRIGASIYGSQLTEFVGIGVPVSTPLVNGLLANTLGQKP